MGFRLQQKSMTLNDLEQGRNGRLLSVVLTSCLFGDLLSLVLYDYIHLCSLYCDSCLSLYVTVLLYYLVL